MSSVVVFAYHNVGVRCLQVLLSQGVDVKLVVTHKDNPKENIWFESVEKLAKLYGIKTITPDDPNVPEVIEQIKSASPDFIFSFYYRHMLKLDILNIPTKGAFNMHGSLLPQYRGRVPVNWAIINGETQTGATLHVMNEKPDNGPIVDQEAIPILLLDTAQDVFTKVCVAAEITLNRALPKLLNGTAELRPQNLKLGRYYGGRKAEDGRINWAQGAEQIHNLVRAVTIPYPGAFSSIQGKNLILWQTRPVPSKTNKTVSKALFYCQNEHFYIDCIDGKVLEVLNFDIEGKRPSATEFLNAFGAAPIPLD